MLKVAILDDYQNVAQEFIDFKNLSSKFDIEIFSEPFENEDNAIEKLKEFEALLIMRERTIITANLIKKLKKLGFKTKILELKDKYSYPVKNLYARLGTANPNFCYAGHLDVVPPGNLNDWIKSSFEPYPQKLTNINLGFNINKLNPETKILINQTIEFFQKIYSDNCRVYIRPSGTEPVMRVLVEAKNNKKVNSLSSEITKKLFLEIDKITN